MAESGSVHQQGSRGIVTKFLGLTSKILGVLLFSAMVSILVEWISMAFFTEPYTGYQHAREMLVKELSYLRVTIQNEDPSLADLFNPGSFIDSSLEWVFIDSGFMQRLHDARTIATDDPAVVSLFKSAFIKVYDYVVAAIYVISTFCVRVTILFLSSPVFILFGAVGFVDGLMQRDLRRFTAGLESSFVYHISKKLIVPTILLAWLVYLALPTSIHPTSIILPFAVGFGLAVMTTASKFKKYV